MRLLNVDTVEEAREKLLDGAKDLHLKTERIPLSSALGRILAEDAGAVEPVPAFRKSTVDGYAVIGQNTQGVTDSIPVFLEVTDEISIGTDAVKRIEPGQCAYVPTGGMIPGGADAMVMVEYAEHFDDSRIAVYQSVSAGTNVIQIGEDIMKDDIFLKSGTEIRPQEAGALAACGYAEVTVFAKPKITIISTGDELVGVDEQPGPGQIRDINTYGIEGLCTGNNIEVIAKKVLKDDEALMEETVREAMEISDIVAVSGGSSQGKKDFTSGVMDRLSQPGVFTHGIALKPGKPTIMACDKVTSTVLIGLPGHPAAAMMVFEFFILWLMRQKTGQSEKKQLTARIQTNVPAGAGRASCLMVDLIDDGDGYTARPILGKSGLITTLTGADGYTFIETNKEGLKEGETVKVTLF